MVIPQHLVSADAIVPRFGPLPGAPVEEIIPIGIPALELSAFGEKLTRGAVYVLDGGTYIEDHQSITVLPLMGEEAGAAKLINQMIRSRAAEHDLGPGFKIGRGRGWMRAEESQIEYPAQFFRFELWGRLVIYTRLLN
jgi:hypothetical protein